MIKFWHIQSHEGKNELIKQGFSWAGLISGLFGFFPLGTIIWMLVRRLWLRALAWFGLTFLFMLPISILDGITKNNPKADSEIGVIYFFLIIPFIILSLITGLYGNKWTMLNRLKKGYIDKGEVEADSEIEAIRLISKETNRGVFSNS